MNKRKTTSIALAAAVAISTVQLAYPANVFANEQITNITTNPNGASIGDGTKESPWDVSDKSDEGAENNVKAYLEQNNKDNNNPKYTLIVYGKGAMKSADLKIDNYGKITEDNRPWKDYIEKITKIDIEDGVKTIGSLSFHGISSCTEVKLSNSVTEIKGSAFRSMTNLKNITFSNKLEKIGNYSFRESESLESLEIPSSVKTIGDGAFRGCTSLKKLILNEGLESINGPENWDDGAFQDCTSIKEVIIPSSCKTLKRASFQGCENLEKVTLKEGVETVEAHVFRNCLKLKSIKIPKSMKAFDLNAVKFGDGKNKERISIDVTDVEANPIKHISHTTELNTLIYFKNKLEKKSDSTNVIAYTNGGVFKDNTVFDSNKLAIPEQSEKVLKGWYDNEKCEGSKVTTIEKDEKDNGNYKTYYASWTEIEDNISLGYSENNTKIIDVAEGIEARIKDGSSKIVELTKDASRINIKSIGVGETTIEYVANNKVLATQNIKVTEPDTVATIGNIPYKSLEEAIKNANGKTIEVKKEAKIELNSALVINNPMTINFNGATLSKKATESNPSTKASDDNCLIKITSEGVIIQNANFDLSNGEEVAILVDGSNAASNVTLGGAVKASRQSTVGTEVEAPVVKMVGANSEVTIKENATVNGTSSPSNGTADKDIIVDTASGASASNITNNNKTSGGGGNYIPSKPTYTHEKIEGLDRYETAAKIADKLGSYDNVVLVNAESSMSDGLAASGLAGKENGAILLTKKDSIPKVTMDRLKKVKKVYIIGGENAISQKVYNEITKNVPNVKIERLGGKTRVETSELVAKKLGNYNKAFVVNGFKGEADAMSASAVAAKNGAPILLTNGKTSTHAKKSGVEYYVIGGDTVVDKSIATKYDAEVLAGKDRYATNKEVIDEFYSGRDKIYFANGETLVDALTASTLAKKDGIALVNAKSDKSVLKGKDTVQVGGMKFTIDFD